MREGLYEAKVWSFDASSGYVVATIPQLFGQSPLPIPPSVARPSDVGYIAPVGGGDTVIVYFVGSDDSQPRWIPTIASNQLVGKLPSFGRRNVVHNSDFKFCQRYGTNTNLVNMTSGVFYYADRWIGAASVATSTPVIFPSYQGVPYVWHIFDSGAVTVPSIGSGGYDYTRQIIMGQDVQHFGIGTTNAKPIVVSFDCFLNNTAAGNFIVEIEMPNGQHCSKSMYIDGDQRRRHVVFPPNPTGPLPPDTTGAGMALNIWHAASSTYGGGSSLCEEWASGGSRGNERAFGQKNMFATASSQLWIRNVQMEVGTEPTPYEYVDRETNRAQCYPFYRRIGGQPYNALGHGHSNNSATNGKVWVNTAYPMRDFANMTVFNNGTQVTNAANTTQNVTAVTYQPNQSRMDSLCFDLTYESLTATQTPIHWRTSNNVNNYIELFNDL